MAQQKTIYGRALKSGFEIELHKSMHYFCARRNHINDVNHSQRFERMQKKNTHTTDLVFVCFERVTFLIENSICVTFELII